MSDDEIGDFLLGLPGVYNPDQEVNHRVLLSGLFGQLVASGKISVDKAIDLVLECYDLVDREQAYYGQEL